MIIKQKALIVVLVLCSALSAEPFQDLSISCDEGDGKACYKAGKKYSAEAYMEADYDRVTAAQKVAQFYRKSCELGYAEGCTAYGMSYMADSDRDIEKSALFYLQRGCDGGDDIGCNLMNLAPKDKNDLD